LLSLKNVNSKKVEKKNKTTTCGFKMFMESIRHYKDHWNFFSHTTSYKVIIKIKRFSNPLINHFRHVSPKVFVFSDSFARRPELNQCGVCVISNSNNRQIAQRQTENSRYVTRNSFCLFTAQCNFHLSKGGIRVCVSWKC